MEPADVTEEKRKGEESGAGRAGARGRTTDLDFTGIKSFLGTTKKDRKCHVSGALETRMDSSKIR